MKKISYKDLQTKSVNKLREMAGIPPLPTRPETPPTPPKQFDTAKEKAEKLVDKYYFCDSTITKDLAKKLAQITVDEIENELIEFGEWSHELQNMEQEFRHLNNVREEIRSL